MNSPRFTAMIRLATRAPLSFLTVALSVLDVAAANPFAAAPPSAPSSSAVMAARAGVNPTDASAALIVAPALSAVPALVHQVAATIVANSSTLGPIFAQTTFDSALRSFLEFLTKILVLIGVALVFYGGWLIGQGKTAEGVLCIIGGFVIAAAVPIMRMLAEMTGTTF